MKKFFLLFCFLVSYVLVLTADATTVISQPVGYIYEAVLDIDNNGSTGCSYTVDQLDGFEVKSGIDYRVSATVLTSNPQVISSITVWKCVNGNFEFQPESSTSIPIGFDNGVDGANVIEFGVPRSAIGSPTGTIRGLFYASQLFPDSDYTAEFTYTLTNGSSSVSVPTLSQWGMILMAILLGLASISWLRKADTPLKYLLVVVITILGISTLAWAVTITLDGNVADWQGIAPIVTDPAGDTSSGDHNEDILYGFVTDDTANVYFRVDYSPLQ